MALEIPSSNIRLHALQAMRPRRSPTARPEGIDQPLHVREDAAGVGPVLLLAVVHEQRDPARAIREVPGGPEGQRLPVRASGRRGEVRHRLQRQRHVPMRARLLQRFLERADRGRVRWSTFGIHRARNASRSLSAVVRWETRPALRTGEFFSSAARLGPEPALLDSALLAHEYRDVFRLCGPASHFVPLLAGVARLRRRPSPRD
jgi:hypothetical protein